MFVRLVLLFILIPMADLVLLLVVNHYLTLFPTIALVIITGVLGAWLAKQQWRWLLSRMRDRVTQQQIPTELFSDGSMILLAAALLVTPGLITDTIGLTLLIPGCRRWYKRRFTEWIKGSFEIRSYGMGRSTDAEIVEGATRERRNPEDLTKLN